MALIPSIQTIAVTAFLLFNGKYLGCLLVVVVAFHHKNRIPLASSPAKRSASNHERTMQWNTIVLNEKVPRSQPWRLGDNDNKKYWFNEEIHTLGNTGILGGLHAAMAPLSTKMIDLLAYNGINVREAVSFIAMRV